MPMKIQLILGLVLGLAGCAGTDPFALTELDKGTPVDVRTLIERHPDATACLDYRASDNSCASLIAARIEGNQIIAVETGAVRGLDGQVTRVSLRSRGRIEEGANCLRAQDITAVDPAGAMGKFLQETSRLLITEYGGRVCARYFTDGDDYVISTQGADGRPFPPGDSRLRFVTEAVSVRVQ